MFLARRSRARKFRQDTEREREREREACDERTCKLATGDTVKQSFENSPQPAGAGRDDSDPTK